MEKRHLGRGRSSSRVIFFDVFAAVSRCDESVLVVKYESLRSDQWEESFRQPHGFDIPHSDWPTLWVGGFGGIVMRRWQRSTIVRLGVSRWITIDPLPIRDDEMPKYAVFVSETLETQVLTEPQVVELLKGFRPVAATGTP